MNTATHFEARASRAFGVALFALCLASAAGAEGRGASRCTWGPITDVPAAQALLSKWVAATNLPTFDKDKSGLGIDHGSVRVILRFDHGAITLAWEIDDDCTPTAVTILASPDYEGRRPDAAAVKQLAASFRTVTVEQHLRAPSFPAPRRIFRVVGVGALLVGLLLLAWSGGRAAKTVLRRVAASNRIRPLDVVAAVFADLRSLARRCHATGMVLAGRAQRALAYLRAMPAASRIRLLGLVGILALLPYQSPSFMPGFMGSWIYANSAVLIGVLPLIAFLWFVLSGYFGYGSPRRDDWPALLVFLFALGIREAYARHGIEGVELHFNWNNGFDRHSVVYTFYVMFLQPLARDPYRVVIHSNGILGAVAALPLYLFIRQRTGNPITALLVATFYAVHPILVQMAPTDSPYSLCFATWFMGLTLLTTAEIGARELVGGAALLGIATTCRAEGVLYLAASLFLIDVRALLRAVRRHLGAAALSLSMLLGLLAVEVHFIFPGHFGSGGSLPVDNFTIESTLKAGLYSTDYNDPMIVILVIAGAVAGLLNKRLRIGLGAAVGTLIVVWPFCGTTTGGYIILHRLSPACALQVIAAGVGASWITSWLAARLRQHWASAIPAVMAALYLLVAHRHEIHNQNGLTDEFWMLRNHLAPGGVVKTECKLVWVGRNMDTDIHSFEQILPGMEGIRCDQRDCLADIAKGGCFYYMRGLNCFHSDEPTAPECEQRGKTPSGGYFDCIIPECVRVETALHLDLIEQRTVDVHSVWNYEHGHPTDPHYPIEADVGLYRVTGVKR